MSPAEGRSLLGHPDLEKSDEIDSAPRRYAEWVLQQLLQGKPLAVNEYADLVELHKVVQGGYLNAIQRGAPKNLLQNLERFLEEVDALTPPPVVGQPMPALSDPASQGMPAPLPG